MELKDIVSVAGEPGLHHVIGRNKNGLIVETIGTGKKFSTGIRHRVSVLSDIAIFTQDGETKLWEVLKALKAREDGGGSLPTSKSDNDEIKTCMAAVLPTYDREKVYTSDMKKLFTWYQMIKGVLNFEKLGVEEEAESETEGTADNPAKVKEKVTPKKVKTTTPKTSGGVKVKTTTPRKMGS
jgi:hypothetical protein